MPDPTIVLAHGAWADGSSWAKVILGLRAAGINSVAAPLPLTSLTDDIAALDRVIARVNGPVILVGHAYAGAVIAGSHSEQVKALVYITALAPDEGETVADVFYRSEPHPSAPKLAPDADGLIWLPQDVFATAFAPHATAEEQAVLFAVQHPIALPCIGTKAGRPLWKDRPTWFLLAESDHMIVPEAQRFMAERMQAQIRPHAVDHIPSVTAPHVVVHIIREAARAVAAH
ncbi:alpha/beta fold hydrolase [Acidisphaera sp. S103]|uniref:alpha/beta fold hydrolase n=1 Tax=Acidisphaera sp. S103 TaxID=1747223 RepID=UPI00131DF490|nr:alpha/beta hydrolase [Acidisphaera sp. S103]